MGLGVLSCVDGIIFNGDCEPPFVCVCVCVCVLRLAVMRAVHELMVFAVTHCLFWMLCC